VREGGEEGKREGKEGGCEREGWRVISKARRGGTGLC